MKFKINGLNWNLKNVPPHSRRLKCDGNQCFGLTDFKRLTIFIDGTMPKELYRQVLIHELVHAFTFSFGVHLIADEKTEESVCDFVGAHFDAIAEILNMVTASGKGGEMNA